MQSIITFTLYLLSILVPLTFTTISSELFEFPKFILLLSGTLIITAAWGIHIYKTRDYKFLDAGIPIINYSVLAILFTQLLATIFSINPYTSFWGYYSRFHGGLLTTICYTIIYFAATKWLDTKSTLKLIKISVVTAILISLYAILERLGIDKNFWVQNVQHRPFSTLGQPNWLAAYLVPNIFLTLYLTFTSKIKKPNVYLILSFSILFIALIFTRSRSGFLAFILSFGAYWYLLARQYNFASIKKSLTNYSIYIVATALLLGSPYTPDIFSLARKSLTASEISTATQVQTGTVLENGGTESGDIRKIVWTGALKLIMKHPILGTGPETFAYTYYWERPTAHNLTTEWDFLYNKAHNEYLNLAAGAGLIGLAAYLYFHFAVFAASFTLTPKSKKVSEDQNDGIRQLYPVLGATIISFFVTNFFGFSVIPVYLVTIMIAALPATITKKESSTSPFDIRYSIFFILVLIYPAFLFYGDYLYAMGKAKNSVELLQKAVAIRPGLDLFHSQLGETYASLGQKDLALKEVDINRKLNPYHLNFYKSRAKIYLTLATIDPTFHIQAAEELEKARVLAPTDPKLAYNLGLIYTRLDKPEMAVKELQAAVAMKPNYQEAYYALTLLYEQTKQVDKIPPLLTSAKTNLATYSAQLRDKIEKYTNLQR